jgi:hypothetical protein
LIVTVACERAKGWGGAEVTGRAWHTAESWPAWLQWFC